MFPCSKARGILVPSGKTALLLFTSSVSNSKRAKGHEAALKRETGSGPACLLVRLCLSFQKERNSSF